MSFASARPQFEVLGNLDNNKQNMTPTPLVYMLHS